MRQDRNPRPGGSSANRRERGTPLSLAARPVGRHFDGGALRSRTSLIAGVRIAERFEVDLAPQCQWPLDPARWKPELLGGTASFHYQPQLAGRRIGLAFTWLRYLATAPEPGETSRADYLGFAVLVSHRTGDDAE